MLNPLWLFFLTSPFWPQVGIVPVPPMASPADLRHILTELLEPPRLYGVFPAPAEADALVVVGSRDGLETVRRLLARPPCEPAGSDQPPLSVA